MDRSSLLVALGASLALCCSPRGGGSTSPPNGSPICSPDASLAVAASPLVLQVLLNDSDPDGDPLSIVAVTSPAHGTATPNSDGTITYTAEAGFRGSDAFGYTVSDGNGGEASGSVSLDVHVIANQEIWTPAGSSPMSPLAVEDAAGGAIVVWMEVSPAGIDLRAKRIGQWGSGGVLVSTIYGSTAGGYTFPAVKAIADGAGGAIVVWTDFLKGTSVDLYAQRLGPDGVARWVVGGVPVCTGPGSDPLYTADDHLAIASDGSGGAIVAWTGGQDPDSVIAAQHLGSSDGAPLWGSCGTTVSGAATGLIEPRLVPDGAGGALVIWWRPGAGGGIGAQRIDGSGAPLWGQSGVTVSAAGYNHAAVSDGAGGAIVAFGGFGGASDSDVRAQRVGAAGDVLWSAGGVVLSAAPGVQEYPRIAPDGAGGAVFAWWDHRGHAYDLYLAPAVYAQRVLADGTVGWTADGVVACGVPVPRTTPLPQVIADGAGGAILAWTDMRDGAQDANVFAQHIDGAGLAAWAANGMRVTDAPNLQGPPSGVSDGAGGAWLVFEDGRANWSIYGQRIAADGSLP